jgi:uncharacterized membrane protein YgaE (UPF0421/DUF939 family)
MSSTQRVIACIVAGVITFLVLALLGMHPSNKLFSMTIVLVIWITATITKKYRNDID